MKIVNWKWDYGVYVPFCPYCDEPAYEKERCVFCGKEYGWVEGEHKPTVVEEGDYTIVQSTNNHISIYEKGELVSHISCTEKCTEEELRELASEQSELEKELSKPDVIRAWQQASKNARRRMKSYE